MRTLLNWRVLGFRVDFDYIMIPILAGSFPLPLLAILIRLLDVKGPVREWYRACCMAAMSVVSGILFVGQDAVCLTTRIGQPTLMFPVAPVLGAVCLVAGWFQVRNVWPKRWRLAAAQP